MFLPKLKYLFFWSLVIFFVAVSSAHAQLSEDEVKYIQQRLVLNQSEQLWLANHQSIKVGVDADYAPYSFVENGKYQGLSVEYLDVFSDVTGVEVRIVAELSWNQIIDDLQSSRLDLITTALKTKERQSFAHFSDFYLATPLVIMSNSDDAEQLSSVVQLAGKRVSVVKNYAATKQLLSEQPSIIPQYFDTPKEALQALALRKVDAYVGVLGVNTYLARKYGWTNVVVAGAYDLTGNKQRFAANFEQEILVGIIDKILSLIPQEAKHRIVNKWLPIRPADFELSHAIELSNDEKRYFEKNKQIEFCLNNTLETYSYINESGKHSGMLAEYLDLIFDALPVEIDYAREVSSSGVSQIHTNESCKLSFHFDDHKNTDDFVMSEAFFNMLSVIVTDDNHPYAQGLLEFEGNKLGVVKNSPSSFLLTPEQLRNTIQYADDRELLIAVSESKVKAAVAPLHSITNSIERFGFSRLKIAGQLTQQSSIRFVANKASLPLITALNKSIARIDISDRNRIAQKWTNVRFDYSGFDLEFILKLGLVTSLVFMFLLYRHRLSLIHSKHLAKANRSLKQAKREAEQANKTKGDFLANMSHEVRTPMNGLMAAVELLKNSSLSEQQKSWVASIERNGLVQISLLNEILDVTKTESGKLSFNPSPCNLSTELRSLLLLVQYRAEQKSIKLTLNDMLPADLVLVTDANIIRQVLLNLVDNAIKYSGADEVEIAVKVISNENSSWRLLFSVSDKGIGIPYSEQKLVFNSFYQGKEQEQLLGTQRGVGLGLSICQSLLSLMFSSLNLKSKPGRGCRFSFKLNLQESENKATDLSNQIAPLNNKVKLTILLVDDDVINADLVASVLTSKGHSVSIANTGKQAVVDAKQQYFDLVLMDIWLPDMSGLEAMKQINQQTTNKARYVVAFTASLLTEDSANYLAQGMDAVLAKPFQLSNFDMVVTQLFQPGSVAVFECSTDEKTVDFSLAKQNSVDFTLALQNCDNDRQRLKNVITKFISMYQGVKFQDLAPEQLAKLCHKLTTGAAIIGATRLSKITSEMSRAESASKVSLAQNLRLQNELNKVVKELNNYLASVK